MNLLIPCNEANAQRFGTVITFNKGWSEVIPFNEKMKRRALALGARVKEN
jgi:hypothetical protein